SRRFGLQGHIHDSGDLVELIGGLSSAAGSDVPQTVYALLTKALSPKNHRVSIYRKRLRNCHVGVARSGRQDDPAPQTYLLWSTVRGGPLPEFISLHFGKRARLPHAPGYSESGGVV